MSKVPAMPDGQLAVRMGEPPTDDPIIVQLPPMVPPGPASSEYWGGNGPFKLTPPKEPAFKVTKPPLPVPDAAALIIAGPAIVMPPVPLLMIFKKPPLPPENGEVPPLAETNATREPMP